MARATLASVKLAKVPIRVNAQAVYAYDKALDDKLALVDRFGDPYRLGKRIGDFLMVPRALAPVSEDRRTRGLAAHFPTTPILRDYQEATAAEVTAFLDQGKSGIVRAWTGWGKTVLGYHCAAHLQRKTVVITTKDDIFEQWIEEAPKFLGIPASQVGRIRGPKCQVDGRSFVVAMIHSLCKEDRYPDEFLRQREFGLVILDEVQRMPADSFHEVGFMFDALWRLGMTAEEKRPDGRDIIALAHIGPVRVVTSKIAEKQVPKVIRLKTDWKCPRIPKQNDKGQKMFVRVPHEPGKTARLEESMARDEARNQIIVDTMRTGVDKGRIVLLFVATHAHINNIRTMLLDEGVDPALIGVYIGVSTKKEREEREAGKRRPYVLSTFSMTKEGTNVVEWDTCIIGIPRANVRQAIGRVRREAEGKKDPLVIDLVDGDSHVLAGYTASRMSLYRSLGCEIVDMF